MFSIENKYRFPPGFLLGVLLCLFLSCSSDRSYISESNRARLGENFKESDTPPHGNFRGWDYLVHKLNQDGVDYPELMCVYQDPRMPEFTHVPFTLRPKEQPSIYSGFTTEKIITQASTWLKMRDHVFDKVEEHFGVTRFIITAILLVETRLGEATGKELVINRLSRLAAIDQPDNLIINYNNLSSDDPSLTFEELKNRAKYLEATFYPEILALFQLAETDQVDILELRGSKAGAFGIPQFLPSSFIKFARDGNGDKQISLFNEIDAIWSVANYLSSYGWNNNAPIEKKKQVLWRYNHSEPYIDTVLKISILLKHRQGLNSRGK